MAAQLSILSKDVRIQNGMYSLNDLHKAAGAENKHRPNYFFTNQQTKELLAEIEIAGIPAIEAKQGVGTYVCKELVYAYAMWISPKFHLHVIRAFDQMVNQPKPQQVIGSEGMRCLSALIKGKTSHLTGREQKSASTRLWNQLHTAFDVCSGMDIPEDQFNDARTFIASYAIEGDYLPADKSPVSVPVFKAKRTPGEFDKRHGILMPQQLFDCGWRVDLLWAVKWLKDHEGQTVKLEPGLTDQLTLELHSILHWYESYRGKLMDIARLSGNSSAH